MALELKFEDTTHVIDPKRIVLYNSYVFVVDNSYPGKLIVFKIVDMSLIHLFTENIMNIVDVYYDGTYLAVCGGFGLSLYHFTESGITLIANAFHENPPGQSTVYTRILKLGNYWHCTCAMSGIQGYELLYGSVLSRVAYRLRDGVGPSSGICSSDGYIYVGNGGPGDQILVLQLNLGTSTYDLLTAYNSIPLGTVDDLTCFKGLLWCSRYTHGMAVIQHLTSPHSLNLIASRDLGQCNDINSSSQYCYQADSTGALLIELSGSNINDLEGVVGLDTLAIRGDDVHLLVGSANSLRLYEILIGISELRRLIPVKTRTQWQFVKMLKRLFPRGPLWRFNIFEEQVITMQSISSSEQWGVPDVSL